MSITSPLVVNFPRESPKGATGTPLRGCSEDTAVPAEQSEFVKVESRNLIRSGIYSQR